MTRCIEPGEILIPLHWVAKALHWDCKSTARRFAAAHMAFQISPRGMWWVASSTVARLFPQVLLTIDEMKARGEFRVPARAHIGNCNARKKAAELAGSHRDASSGGPLIR